MLAGPWWFCLPPGVPAGRRRREFLTPAIVRATLLQWAAAGSSEKLSGSLAPIGAFGGELTIDMSTNELIIIGDRVLIQPEEPESRTASGLFLPAGVREKDRVQSGRVIKTGPGHLIPNPEYTESESWAGDRESVRYLPLQAQPGDFALFLRKDAIDIEYLRNAYLIVPHSAIVALVRSQDESDLLDQLGLS
ncbi:hypothetical protein BH23BAC4_BH23BAC4_03680 [soil metagenome]